MLCINSDAEDSGMEVSNSDCTTSETSSETDNCKFSDINGHSDSDKEIEPPPRLFKFSIVNSYGNAEMDYKLKDDGTPLRLNSKLCLHLAV